MTAHGNSTTALWRAAALAAVLVCWPILGRAEDDAVPQARLRQLWSRIRSSGAYEQGIPQLEAFAVQQAGHPDAVARAHLLVVDCLERKGDLDAAVAKAKWLAGAFPKARAPQFIVFGEIPRTMAEEWRAWADKNPIHMKDFAWAKLSELYGKSRRWDDQLAAYDHLLATVPPDPLPDTKNIAIFRASRLHRDALASKIQLLRRLRRLDEAKEAERLQEKLYPAAAWRKAHIACDRTTAAYSKESEELIKREREAELKRIREADEKTRKEREAEEEEQRRREEAMRARDEERKQKYLKHKRESRKKEKEAPPPPPERPEPAPASRATPAAEPERAEVTRPLEEIKPASATPPPVAPPGPAPPTDGRRWVLPVTVAAALLAGAAAMLLLRRRLTP